MFSRVLKPQTFSIFLLALNVGISSAASASVKGDPGDPNDQEVVLETTASSVAIPTDDSNESRCQIRVSVIFSYLFPGFFQGFISNAAEPKTNRVEILPETEQALAEAQDHELNVKREAETKALENHDEALGTLAILPIEIRRMIYSQLDHRSLGNLELASHSLNNEIETQKLWIATANRMSEAAGNGSQVPTDGGNPQEGLSKQWIKKRIIREMKQTVVTNPEGHGIQSHTLFLAEENFNGKGLQSGDFVRANFKGAQFVQARLESANFPFAVLNFARFCRADLSEANLDGASLCDAELNGAIMVSVRMRTTVFQNAKMNEVDLTSADARDADFSGANLENATFESTVISGANFSGANLNGTILTREILISSGCQFDSKTQFSSSRSL